MADSPSKAHKAAAPSNITCAVITVSDTRTIETDRGGQKLMDHLIGAGYEVTARHIIKDDPEPMRQLLQQLSTVDAILMTGGTGVSQRDQTYETVSELLEKPLPGYGELFRMLSYQEIGAPAMLSRAVGGIRGKSVILTMPGSPAAVDLAMEKIVLAELPHLVQQARS